MRQTSTNPTGSARLY